ncbi:MAG TPA: radical SAM protein [Methanotrichaceae archaeon]|nr:radical SAM protein [Methanotrichaceae archaeon]
MNLLRPFDPWKCELCTCLPKLSLNPYTGCSHGCLYCYASSYIPRFHECRPKKDLLVRLKMEVQKVRPGELISASNSSDPYPPQERELELTRECVSIIKKAGLRLQVVTKSDIAARDADLLEEMDACVSITLTTLQSSLSEKLEPGAPPPASRLDAMRLLHQRGIPVSARIDPIIPCLNLDEIEDLVHAAAIAGAQHITSSTFKARHDSLRRLATAFPDVTEKLVASFKERTGSSICLPRETRRTIMDRACRAARQEGLTFSSCREGFSGHAPSCDGSHLIGLNLSSDKKSQR